MCVHYFYDVPTANTLVVGWIIGGHYWLQNITYYHLLLSYRYVVRFCIASGDTNKNIVVCILVYTLLLLLY